MNDLDARIFDHVRSRHGIVTPAELRRLGASRGAVRRRMESGALRPVFRCVYVCGAYSLTPYGRWLAAALVCGSDAVISHQTAAVLWRLIPPGLDDGPHVTVVRQVRPPNAIALHRASHLPEGERTKHHGVPVTSPARTLLDIAPHVSKRRLSRAIRQAEVTGLVKHDALVQLAGTGRRGVVQLRSALAPVSTPTRSSFEDDVVDLLRALPGAPQYVTNARVDGHEVDIYVPSENLAIEVDGGRWHDTPQARHEDRLKQAALEAAGATVKRIRGA